MFGIRNTTGGSLILASVLAVSSGYVFAQNDNPGPKDGERPAKRQADGKQKPGEPGEPGERGPRGPRDGERMHRMLFEGMELTDDQKAQIKELMQAHGEERKAWHEEHKEEFQALRDKMREAREAKDKEAADAVREETKALMESAPKPDAVHDEIRAVLTEDQQAIFDERVAKMRERADEWREPGGPGPRIFGNLDLTDDQQAQLREIMQSDKTREEKMEDVRAMLTDEQKTKLDENIEKMRKLREERGERGDRPRRGGPGGEGGGEGGRRGGPGPGPGPEGRGGGLDL
jgi:Spy/CpxP family protein refolding chaperone